MPDPTAPTPAPLDLTERGKSFGSYDPRLDGRPYDPDYEDESGSSHIRPCPHCGAGTDEPCDDGCVMTGDSNG